MWLGVFGGADHDDLRCRGNFVRAVERGKHKQRTSADLLCLIHKRRGHLVPQGLTCLKRHRALSMRFPPLRPDRQATCALPGWMYATVLYGMSTTAVQLMAARPGQASPSSPATWRVTATFNPMALVFRSEIILKWALIAAATHRSFGAKG